MAKEVTRSEPSGIGSSSGGGERKRNSRIDQPA